jgi:S1-C subfamily serine protease
VKAVRPESPAAKVGLKVGDVLTRLNGYPVASFADAQYALHKAPAKGEIPVEWDRAGQPASAKLTLADGWRKTNVTWRPSMLDILPSLPLSGDDLTADEKKALGLSPTRLAFRQDPKVHRDVKAAGVQGGDVVIGLGGATFERTMSEFLGHVRRNYLAGDRVVLNVLRAGKRVDLPLTLK